MPVNWYNRLNPQTIPYLRYIPEIALPTVFGDALTYTEQVGKVNATINKVISGFNDLAQDVINSVAETIQNTKLPVYGEMVYRSSPFVTPNNWSLGNPEEILEAVEQGCMCIVEAKCDFNIDGLPVYSESMLQMFVLTQVYQYNVNENDLHLNLTFMSYNDTKVRYLTLRIMRENGTVTTETDVFVQKTIPTLEYIDNFKTYIAKKIMVYVGDVAIPREEGQFIELLANGTEVDIAEYFITEPNGHIYAAETAPCVVIDFRSGRVGRLQYGGAGNPWVRVYSTGYRVNSDTYTLIADLREDVSLINAKDVEQDGAIEDLQTGLGQVIEQADQIEENLTELGGEAVTYTAQNKTAEEKAQARANIGAPSDTNPVLKNNIILLDPLNNRLRMQIAYEEGEMRLIFSDGSPRITGVSEPVNRTDVANKKYVDDATAGMDNVVLYTAQSKDLEAQSIARENIGAVGTYQPYFYGYIALENAAKSLIFQLLNDSGSKVLSFGGTAGETRVANVATPVNDNDAATKAYVDTKAAQIGETVKYAPQTLTESQKDTARSNIGAAADENPTIIGETLVVGGGANEGRVFEYMNDTGAANIDMSLWVNTSDKSVRFYDDGNESVVRIKTNTPVDDDDCVNKSTLDAKTTPVVLAVNSSVNRWTIESGAPAVVTLEWVVAQLAAGRPVIAKYEVSDETFIVGYATPLYANYRTGLVFYGNDNVSEKKYVLNNDGTCTITAL